MTVVHGLAELPTETTVAIAGGGPSGTYLALALARHGIESVVVEPRETIDHFRPRAKTTNTRTMTLLAELGLADAVRDMAALPVDYSQDVMFATSLTGYELRRFHGAFQLDAGRYEVQPECGQQIPQPDVEEVLRAAAVDSPLITYVTGVRAAGTDLSDQDAPVLLVTGAKTEGQTPAAFSAGDPNAQPGTASPATNNSAPASDHRLAARWIVGADGGSSTVRKSLGIKLSGTTAPKANFNVVFKSEKLRERVTLDPAVQWWIVGEYSGMIGELDRDGTWWTILQGTDPIEDHDELKAALRSMAGVGDDVDIDVLATDSWTARMLLTESESYGYAESGGTVFLVGDAAHLNPPWGGHGFNTCISDAANLVWKLAAVHSGWADETLLASYGAERRPVAARMIADAATNGKALAFDFVDPALADDTEGGRAARARVHEALAVKTGEFHSEGLVLGYEYANTPWVQPGPVPFVDAIEYRPQALPGCLLPHFWRTDGTSVYPTRTDFTLFTVDGENGEQAAPVATEALVTTAKTAGIPLNSVRLSGADADRARTLWGDATAVLVRPDRHIAVVVPAPGTRSTDGAQSEARDDADILVNGLLTAAGFASVEASPGASARELHTAAPGRTIPSEEATR